MPTANHTATTIVTSLAHWALAAKIGIRLFFKIVIKIYTYFTRVICIFNSQVLTNLLKNAAEAIEKKSESAEIAGEIRVSLLQSGDRAELTIQDNGIGLPADRSKLFEPYYTTRSEGTGLGLPIVKKIVEDHGGSLALEIAPEFAGNSHCGAMALIMLPLNETLDDNGTL